MACSAAVSTPGGGGPKLRPNDPFSESTSEIFRFLFGCTLQQQQYHRQHHHQ